MVYIVQSAHSSSQNVKSSRTDPEEHYCRMQIAGQVMGSRVFFGAHFFLHEGIWKIRKEKTEMHLGISGMPPRQWVPSTLLLSLLQNA